MISSAKYIISSPDVKDCPQSNLPEYAFIGRSNVGKSSLINMLCHNPKLAKTSQKPGKTLLINHFLVQSTDRSAEGSLHCKTANAVRDCRHEPQKIDLEFLAWLGENGVPFAIVFTKGDKLGRVRLAENVEAYKKRLLEEWEELPPVFVTSSETKLGGEELTSYIEKLNEEIKS